MNKATSNQSERGSNINKARKQAKEGFGIADSLLQPNTWQRTTLGVAAAAGGGLLAVAMLGVGPAAIAGTAGYLAYRGLSGKSAKDEAGFSNHKH